MQAKASIPQKPKVDISEVYRLIDAGLSQGAVSRQLGCTQGYVSKLLKARAVSGSPQSEPGAPDEHTQAIETVHYGSPDGSPTTALQPMEYRGELGSPSGLPDIARQTDLDNLKTRVEVLETFIARLHQPAAYLPGSPNGSSGSPTHKRGFVMADDLFDAIHTYAKAHHLQVKDVLDLALRRFFAQVGQEVPADV